MPEDQAHFKRVLKFWRATEIFALPDAPMRKAKDRKIYTEVRPGAALPWQAGLLAPAGEGKQWKHTLYFFIAAKEEVIDLLARLSRSNEYRERVGGDTYLSAICLDQSGRPAKDSYAPAAFSFGIKILREGLAPDKVGELLRKAREEALARFGLDKQAEEETGAGLRGEGGGSGAIDWETLEKEIRQIRELVKGQLKSRIPLLCVTEQAPVAAGLEPPFLNSYYFGDLNRLITEAPRGLGRPLEKFLSAEVEYAARRNLLDPLVLLERIHPRNLPAGRWPSDPDFGLYAAQQTALAEVLTGLRDEQGLFGINGPPGTGKTTLLKEVVVDVVVNKARRLLKADVSRLFSSKWNKIGAMVGYYAVDPAVMVEDGIVVSSNNNAAVENVSKELPVLRSIDWESFGEAGYFSEIASRFYGEESWGLLSAVLGKSANRSSFVTRFWYDGVDLRHFLKEQAEEPLLRDQNAACYAAAAEELKVLLQEFDEFRELAVRYHERIMGVGMGKDRDEEFMAGNGDGEEEKGAFDELRNRLSNEYGIVPENLPDLSFADLPMDHIHPMMPYSSDKVNRLRSRIFLKSLELLEYAIRVNAKAFRSNLHAFVQMVSGKQPELFDEETTAVLWNSFFFCVPLVSVTLASFEKQFAKMRRGSIGWLLLDEAGQATPASACGAIWRSRRCIVIGDTMQIQPVVNLPRALVKMLQDHYQVKEECWSPIDHSVQHLADRVTSLGTYIYLSRERVNWTGIPLRAHRRCGDPMFTISNAIAYDGQMVKVREEVPVEIVTGASGWIDVAGVTVVKGHAIGEELQVVADLLQMLAGYRGKLFIISPFRIVAELCREEFQEAGRVECGTIHTFQGKEAEVVILVLGTEPGNSLARDWVAASPHMLNVAVTRAKERLYVIGNRKAWAAHDYFSYLAKKLPVKEHFSGRLF